MNQNVCEARYREKPGDGSPEGFFCGREASKFCWVPSGYGNASLLLGYLMQSGPIQWNSRVIASALGISFKTLRKWRDYLLECGAAKQSLRVISATDEQWRRSPIPWEILRDRGFRPETKRAMAEILREGFVTYEVGRPGFHTDAERAENQGLCRRTIIRARKLLIEKGFFFVVKLLSKVRYWLRLVRVGKSSRTPLVKGEYMSFWSYTRARRYRKASRTLKKLTTRVTSWRQRRRVPSLRDRRIRLQRSTMASISRNSGVPFNVIEQVFGCSETIEPVPKTPLPDILEQVFDDEQVPHRRTSDAISYLREVLLRREDNSRDRGRDGLSGVDDSPGHKPGPP